jgi:hypothetical protein
VSASSCTARRRPASGLARSRTWLRHAAGAHTPAHPGSLRAIVARASRTGARPASSLPTRPAGRRRSGCSRHASGCTAPKDGKDERVTAADLPVHALLFTDDPLLEMRVALFIREDLERARLTQVNGPLADRMHDAILADAPASHLGCQLRHPTLQGCRAPRLWSPVPHGGRALQHVTAKTPSSPGTRIGFWLVAALGVPAAAIAWTWYGLVQFEAQTEQSKALLTHRCLGRCSPAGGVSYGCHGFPPPNCVTSQHP